MSLPWLLLVIISLVSLTISQSLSDTPTAYEVLKQYDFPVGILPKGVLSYELDKHSGKFKVHLNESCAFTIQDYDLKYKSTITGVIAKDRISKLKGISVQILFLGFNIGQVNRKGDKLEFSVGIMGADFPVESFLESPQCGCGFDCGIRVAKNGRNVIFNTFSRFLLRL